MCKMFDENSYQAMKILREEDQENILNALGLFEKKKLIHVQEKLTDRSTSVVWKKKELTVPTLSIPQTKLDYRRSLRIYTKSVDDFGNNVVSKISSPYPAEVFKVHFPKKSSPPNVYGSLKGVSIGDTWRTRIECSYAGVHKPTVAGIHAGREGAYSVAISGEYEDDQDNGYCFTYTGCGGRDLTGTKYNKKNLRTAPQSKDQTPDGANASLIKSIVTRNPIRVIRGYKLDSPFAPLTGYRYDGLYTVEKYWTCMGRSGFLVYKFLMKRCQNQPPAPWYKEFKGPRNRIKIVKLRRRKPEHNTTVLNLSGKLTMNEDNGDKITTCQVSEMKLKLNTEDSQTLTIGSSGILIKRDCEVQLDPSETITYQQKIKAPTDEAKPCSRTCVNNCEQKTTDDSNKENNNKVIIKTRWRRSRLSLPNTKSTSSAMSVPSRGSGKSEARRGTKRLSFPEKSNIKKSFATRRSLSRTPPSIAYFNATNEESFKWSLFASEAEIRKFQKHISKNNRTECNIAEDFEGEFRGFEKQDSLNKVMILGFILDDLAKK